MEWPPPPEFNSRLVQPMQQARTNRGETMAQEQCHISTPSHPTWPTRMDCDRLFSDSPNSSINRNGPICFKCGEQGHMRHDCTEYFATIARAVATVTKHAESLETIHPAPQIATFPQDTTPQPHHCRWTHPPWQPMQWHNQTPTVDLGSTTTRTTTFPGPAPQCIHFL